MNQATCIYICKYRICIFHKVKLKYKLFFMYTCRVYLRYCTQNVWSYSLNSVPTYGNIYRCSSTNLPEKFVFMCLVGLNIILFPGQYIPSIDSVSHKAAAALIWGTFLSQRHTQSACWSYKIYRQKAYSTVCYSCSFECTLKLLI